MLQTDSLTSTFRSNGAPTYLASALVGRGMYPCKVIPSLNPPCRLSMNNQEFGHPGRYDLLPFDPSRMEFVRAASGHIPHGRRPVQGGHEENGDPLYHAVVAIGNARVPGKTAPHLVCITTPCNTGSHAHDML